MNRLQAELDAGIRLELIGQMITDTFWDGFSHTHTFDELIYVLKGPVWIARGEERVELNRGEMVFVPKGEEHKILSREPSSFMYLGFQTNLFSLSPQKNYPLAKNYNHEIARLALCLEEVSEKAQRERVSLERFSSQVILHLIPALSSLEQETVTKESKEILSKKIKEYIALNLHKPIRVDELAAGLYHSAHYIGNLFIAVNGVTIKEYALQYKMHKALELLGQEGLSVGATAMRLGYDSPHYFSKCFKEYYGFSPSKLPHKSEEK